MQSPNDWKNVEITGYVKYNEGKKSNENFDWYARGDYIRMQIKELKEQLTKEICIILVTPILEKSSGMKMALIAQMQR
jgi:hypothetical protein